MVALLQVAIVIPEGLVVENREFLILCVELVVGVLLEFVSEPCGEVPLLVRPRDGLRNVEWADSLVELGNLSRGRELEGSIRENRLRKMSHELEYAAGCRSVLSESLVVHEEVDYVAAVIDRVLEPAKIGVGIEVAAGETERDVIAQGVVPKEQFEP